MGIASGLVGFAIVAVGCSSSDDAVATADASDDATRREGGALGADDAAACDPDANLFAKVSDAAIADGASTTGACLGCAKVSCAPEVDQCTRDCPCQGIVSDAVGCYVTTQQLGCAGALTDYLVTAETRKNALKLLGCVRTQCADPCAIDGGADLDAADAD